MPKRTYQPILNTLEILLQGGPWEFMDVKLPDQPESDRAAYVRCAESWVRNPALAADEIERIRAVWIDGEYRKPLNVARVRREELRALIVPRRKPSSRPDAEELQMALAGAE